MVAGVSSLAIPHPEITRRLQRRASVLGVARAEGGVGGPSAAARRDAEPSMALDFLRVPPLPLHPPAAASLRGSSGGGGDVAAGGEPGVSQKYAVDGGWRRRLASRFGGRDACVVYGFAGTSPIHWLSLSLPLGDIV
nr:hypothetical protein Iba_chr10eCG14340 [Ipomoea batatas]